MAKSVTLILLLAGLSAGSSSAVGAASPGRFAPSDAFALSQATDVQISPDGTKIAYTRASGDVMIDGLQREVWLIDVASGRQVPLGQPGSTTPRWSPDGKRLAYVAPGRSDRPQIFVRWLASGASTAATALPDVPSALSWSPDGETIAFMMQVPAAPETLGAPIAKPEGAKWAEPLRIISRVSYRADGRGYLKPGASHVFLVPSTGGAARQLTTGAVDDGTSIVWTPNGRRLLIVANHAANRDWRLFNTDIYAVDVESGAAIALTTRDGPDQDPAVSPDGRLIAFVGFGDQRLGYQNHRLQIMNSDGTGHRDVPVRLDRDVYAPRWAADGKSLYVDYADHGVTKVAKIGLDGHLVVVASDVAGSGLDRPYSSGDFTVSRSGRVAFALGDASHPPDVAVAAGGRTRRLTDLNAGLFAGKSLADLHPLAVTSSADGLPIDAWMLTPPGFDPKRKYPLILEIHGGPFLSYGPLWSTSDQMYAASGYIVVYANPRGSTSYGEEFANRIHHDYPSKDYDDLMSVVDRAIATGSVDDDNLFVTGGSGGGLLTAWVVGKTGRFRAAVSQKPVIDWASEVLTTDRYNGMAEYWFGVLPWEDPQQYWRRSPLSLVGRVTTPTALIVGDDDLITTPDQAEEYYAALQLRHVPTVLIKVPGAGHGSLATRPSQLVAENNAILAWFARYQKHPGPP